MVLTDVVDAVAQIDFVGTVFGVVGDFGGPDGSEHRFVMFGMCLFNPIEPFTTTSIFGDVCNIKSIGLVVGI